MKSISVESLRKIITRRLFDWHMVNSSIKIDK